MKILRWFHGRKQHSQLAISPSALDRQGCVRIIGKWQWKNVVLNTFPYPMKKLWVDHSRTGWERRKTFQNKKPQVYVVPFIHPPIRKSTNSLTLKSGRDRQWVPQQKCPNCPGSLIHELPVMQGAIPQLTGIIRCAATASDVNTNVKSQRSLCRIKIQ